MAITEKQQLAKTAAHWYKECEQLKERIRELERVLFQMQNAAIDLGQRMAKAREILEKLVGSRNGKEIMQAIAILQGHDALEGK